MSGAIVRSVKDCKDDTNDKYEDTNGNDDSAKTFPDFCIVATVLTPTLCEALRHATQAQTPPKCKRKHPAVLHVLKHHDSLIAVLTAHGFLSSVISHPHQATSVVQTECLPELQSRRNTITVSHILSHWITGRCAASGSRV